MTQEIVIVSGVRTPQGNFNGMLSGIGATDLGAVVIKEAVARAGIKKRIVNEVIMGMVLPCGYGQNPARQAAIKAGMPWGTAGLTINKVCGSGLKAIMLAVQAIKAGDANVVVAGGMENMSLAPYFLEKARFGYRMGPGKLRDHMLRDGLWDHVNDFHMGMSNELSSKKYKISRKDQDKYAAESYKKTLAAIKAGKFKKEIIPVSVPQRKGDPVNFEADECPKKTTYQTLSKMEPMFKKKGRGTAGNASIISDGASAVVVMTREKAEKLGCGILAGIGSYSTSGIDMKYTLVAPVKAIPKCLKKEGISTEDVDLYEINEAFSGSTLAILRELKLDRRKVNVNGGAIALGHPLGASGCRVLVTLIHEMIRSKKKTGLASLCLGGGEGVAMIVKR